MASNSLCPAAGQAQSNACLPPLIPFDGTNKLELLVRTCLSIYSVVCTHTRGPKGGLLSTRAGCTPESMRHHPAPHLPFLPLLPSSSSKMWLSWEQCDAAAVVRSASAVQQHMGIEQHSRTSAEIHVTQPAVQPGGTIYVICMLCQQHAPEGS